MATSKEQAQTILDKISGLGDVRIRAMMGEYVLYFEDRVIGGIYDGELLLKTLTSATALLGEVPRRVPYAGAKEMLIVRDFTDLSRLRQVFLAMAKELPPPKKKARKTAPKSALHKN